MTDVRRMLAVQVHRGPEGIGVRSAGPATFGACHLRFVDPDGVPQPFSTPDGSLLLTFNGEIYNADELRASVAAPAWGDSEAALLAALYRAEGAAMVRRLRGMFAIAIFDGRHSETVLIRDPLGQKPLSYTVRGGEVRFSSELTGLSSVAGGVDPAAVRLYLQLNAVPAPFSLLSGVRKVEAGAVVRITGSTVHSERYWRPRVPTGGRRRATPDTLDAALRAATRRRLPQQPLGVFLSGGLDSGLIAAMAAREGGAPLHSYSLGYPDTPTFDETGQATRMAQAVGTRHRVIRLTLADMAAAAPRWLAAVDEPVADHSLVPTTVLALAARRDVKAVLTGDGADELAMGYALFAAERALRQLSRALGPLRVQRLLTAAGRLPATDRNLSLAHVADRLARTVTAAPERQYYAAGCALPFDQHGWLLTAAAHDAGAAVDPFDGVDDLLCLSPDATPSERLALGMVCHFLRDVILTKVDRATMLASLEARSPFLDLDVVQLLLATPVSQRLHRLTGKHLVRTVATRYLPRGLVHQRKRGFRAPIGALLRGPLRSWLTDLLASDTLRDGGLLRPDAVASLLGEHLSGRVDHHRLLWSVACLQTCVERVPQPRTSELRVAS